MSLRLSRRPQNVQNTARQERGGYGADTDAHRSTRTHKPVDQ